MPASSVSAKAGCTSTAGTVTCSFDRRAARATQAFTIVFHIHPTATGLFFFNDTATTEISTLSLHDALPISTATTTAQRVADLAIAKTAPATASAGTDITYTLTVTN